MVSIEKTALPDKRIEINAYTTDASLNDVLAYYNGALSGWTQTAKNDQGGIYIARWSAGKTKGFAVYYNRNTAGGANIVLLEQFWR